ncbi:MAG: serine protein kinase PrkA [Myxococcales bacterium]|nr:serine protein kinase PrkA [Myxococcales bacterium]MCB9576732.1 serine protein kinase PrkA [Polyangiaceae bacterium]
MGSKSILEELEGISRRVQRGFEEERRLLSFSEYLELFSSDPVRHSRDAARYLRDMFDHFGRTTVQRPWGELTRFSLFDLPFTEEDSPREALVGHEAVQAELYRILCNFVREGRPNRVMLLHGPNGSAKSTAAACLMRALEHYSSEDEGALYRFHWVFPNQGKLKGSIGFTGQHKNRRDDGSYAHLPEDQIDARLHIEVRDHPLFLLPQEMRASLLSRLYEEAEVPEPPPAWIVNGSLSHKSQQVFEALLTSYEGSLEEVLRHVQVERYFISRRYRVGAVTLGPQLSVDAGERQVTADRSLSALPSSLQAVTLFEAFGELVDAAGGLLEFSDLLKRPLDAFKYLQITAETGEVALRSQNVQVNCVMLASGNEVHLAAFREHPEFESFRGRLELVRMPYLRSWVDEKSIYDAQIVPKVRRHVAPHATEIAAMFAVLTRMRRPKEDRYEKPLRDLVSELTALEKMDLYSTGSPPSRLDDDGAKLLRSAIFEMYRESDSYPIYEGSIGASPREMRTLLLDAAQNPRYQCLSPLAVLEELDRLCERTSEYAFLQEEKVQGGYHDHKHFREALKERLLDSLEDELRVASGLVDEIRYVELFDRYITHVSFWVKNEKLRNPLTGDYEDPDQRLMQEVEALLGVPDKPETLRHSLINTVAAWAIDHPGQSVDNSRVFAAQLRRMRDAAFAERRIAVARLCRDVVMLLREDGDGLDDARKKAAREVVDRMIRDFGYEEASAGDAAVVLTGARFADLLV